MSRNFGFGSRDMGKAGEFAMNEAARSGECSYSTAATVSERFGQFTEYAKVNGAKYMEYVTPELVREYGQVLAERVERGEIAASTAQNYVSAVNTVMSNATKGTWASVSPTKDCCIEQRCAIRAEAPEGIDREVVATAATAVRSGVGERAASVVELCREFGLRSKEASLMDARWTLLQAIEKGSVTISEGTKGGRDREVPITSETQIKALQKAAEAQGADKSMIPAAQTWKEWREGDLRNAREIVQEHTGGGLHDLRASYTCERYEKLTGHAAPVCGGTADKVADREARATLAAELGHGRIDVVAEYVGGRK